MPYIVTGDPKSWTTQNYSDKNFSYKYPEGLNLKPGSDLHDKLRNVIWAHARESRNVMQCRFSSWKEIDKTLTTYISVSDAKSLEEDTLAETDPDKPTSIVFPYSYSMLEALLTYMSMAFFQDPTFQYEGVEDDDTVGAMLMEMCVRLHCIKHKVNLNLHTMFRDSFAYGIAPTIPTWLKTYGNKAIRSTNSTESPLGLSQQGEVRFEYGLLFEGNALSNIDPYMWLPDPSVSSSDVQKGEFEGFVDRTNYMTLLSEETNQKGSGLFNVKYLKSKLNRRSTLALDESSRQDKFGGVSNPSNTMSESTSLVDVIKMCITLIPKDYELSESESPEKWYFELASDDIIIRCEKANYNHGLYPVAVASPEFDGYSPTPIARLEILYGLQHTLDFLFNSHITNVRKAINDMLIVDPYLVNINDLKSPKPGKLIRLRRPAWGRGVDKVVQQLAVQDITRANISDSAYITQFMDRLGADQSMMGSLRMGGPERLTGAEFQGTRSSAIGKLQRIAMIISLQAMQDIGTMFAAHTQQYQTQETYVKIVGRHADQLNAIFAKTNQQAPSRLKVTPYDLAIATDLIVRDGSIPGGNFSSAWIDLFKTIGTQPELASQFDIVRIFMYIANQLGAKNVEDFKRVASTTNVVTMPDAKVMNEVQKGNLIPTNEVI
jgi:hypothetical protein